MHHAYFLSLNNDIVDIETAIFRSIFLNFFRSPFCDGYVISSQLYLAIKGLTFVIFPESFTVLKVLHHHDLCVITL